MSLRDGHLPTIDTPAPANGRSRQFEVAASRNNAFFSSDIYVANNPPTFYLLAIPAAELSLAGGRPGGPLLGVRLMGIAFTLGGVGLTYLLAWEIARDRLVALAAAGFLATMPSVAVVTAYASLDGPALAATTAITWTLVRLLRRGRPVDALWLGIACALGASVRPMALAFAGVAGDTASSTSASSMGPVRCPGCWLGSPFPSFSWLVGSTRSTSSATAARQHRRHCSRSSACNRPLLASSATHSAGGHWLIRWGMCSTTSTNPLCSSLHPLPRVVALVVLAVFVSAAVISCIRVGQGISGHWRHVRSVRVGVVSGPHLHPRTAALAACSQWGRSPSQVSLPGATHLGDCRPRWSWFASVGGSLLRWSPHSHWSSWFRWAALARLGATQSQVDRVLCRRSWSGPASAVWRWRSQPEAGSLSSQRLRGRASGAGAASGTGQRSWSRG